MISPVLAVSVKRSHIHHLGGPMRDQQPDKGECVCVSVLARTGFTRPFCVQTEANNYLITGDLTQELDGEEHSIYYIKSYTDPGRTKFYHNEKRMFGGPLVSTQTSRLFARRESYRSNQPLQHVLTVHSLIDPTVRLTR